MQREIKFRVWDTTKKEMVQVKQIIIPDGNDENELQELAVSHLKYGTNPSHWLITSSIMQYTGHKDKNGKEIYEGDIVSEFGQDKSKQKIESRYSVCFEIYASYEYYRDKLVGGSGWYLSEKSFFRANKKEKLIEQPPFTSLMDASNLEVIGNIYSNPELVEEKWQKY